MRWGVTALCAVVWGGCFGPNFADEQVTCESGLCPPGFFCVDGICQRTGGTDPVDASSATIDAPAIDAAIDAIPPVVAILINVNGPAHTGVDFPGDWEEDQGGGAGGTCNGSEGGSLNSPVQGTVDDPLFATAMFNGNINCEIGKDLPVGEYDVTVLAAEIFFGPNCPGGGVGTGSRVFDVRIEGDILDANLDLYELSNGCVSDPADADAAPFAKTYRHLIDDGEVDLRLQSSVGSALISAIKVAGPVN